MEIMHPQELQPGQRAVFIVHPKSQNTPLVVRLVEGRHFPGRTHERIAVTHVQDQQLGQITFYDDQIITLASNQIIYPIPKVLEEGQEVTIAIPSGVVIVSLETDVRRGGTIVAQSARRLTTEVS